MRLRHTAEYTAAIWLITGVVVALIAVEGALIQVPDQISTPMRIFALFPITTYLVVFPIVRLWGGRRLRHITTGSEPLAPVARHQPNPALALAPGETLRLPSLPLRQQPRWSFGVTTAPIFVFLLEVFVFVLEPPIGQHLQSLVYGVLHAMGMFTSVNSSVSADGAPLTPAQWALMGAPVLIVVIFLGEGLLLRSVAFRERLIADDSGLTWDAPLRRTRFIAWGDVHWCIVGASAPAYCILSRREVISFDAPLPPGLARPATPAGRADLEATPPSRRPDPAKVARDGDDALAERIVATIISRSRRPLLLADGVNYTAEDVRKAPLANDRTARKFAPTQVAGATLAEPLVLQVKLPMRSFFRWSFRWALLIPAAYLLLLLGVSPRSLIALRPYSETGLRRS